MKGIFSATIWVVAWFFLTFFTFGFAIFPFALVLFLIFVGGEERELKGFDNLSSALMREERLLVQAIQKRVFALWHRRLVIGITNSRVVIVSRGLLGGFTMKDIQWKDLTDARLEQNILSGICGSNITFRHANNGVGLMELLGIAHDRAAEIYAYSQQEEQAWEEKRRVRGMEESRAASGGVYVNTAPLSQPLIPAPTSSASAAPNRMLEEIERAKALLDSGIISDSEFQEMKSKIISGS